MNSKLEKYKEAVDSLPQIEKQIEVLLRIKERLYSETELCPSIMMRIDLEKDEKEKLIRTLNPFTLFQNMMMTGRPLDPELKTEPSIEINVTDFVKLNKEMGIRICDVMLQELIQKKDSCISTLTNFSNNYKR
jgi:hypothetical protein